MNRILFFTILCGLILHACVKQDTVSPKAQFHSDTITISSFVKSTNPTAIKMATGFWYSIDTLGDGIYPALTDTITISYTARKIPGLEQVDYSDSTEVVLSTTISGLQQGLVFFPAKSFGRVYIPSGLAFGVSTHNEGRIPPNANLLYEVKLISVKGPRLTNDITAIDSYLQANSIVAEHDIVSGIRYNLAIDSTLTNPPKPSSPDDFITVTYTERIMNADTLLTSVSAPVKIALKDQITAWRIMFPKYLAEGSTITIYTPSGYAYGSPGKQNVPANSNMIYVITLVKVN